MPAIAALCSGAAGLAVDGDFSGALMAAVRIRERKRRKGEIERKRGRKRQRKERAMIDIGKVRDC